MNIDEILFQAMKLRVLTGVHSPDQFRVQVKIINFKRYLYDFILFS